MNRIVERINKDTALAVHAMQIKRHGGMPGLRDDGLLEAALAQPWMSFGGIELYATAEEKAARLCFEIISQHPFADGNKRTGAALMGALLRANGISFKPRASDFEQTILGVASGSLDYADLLDFVRRSK